jgi:hypothetical protein
MFEALEGICVLVQGYYIAGISTPYYNKHDMRATLRYGLLVQSSKQTVTECNSISGLKITQATLIQVYGG